jgi:hypothetical protein
MSYLTIEATVNSSKINKYCLKIRFDCMRVIDLISIQAIFEWGNLKKKSYSYNTYGIGRHFELRSNVAILHRGKGR